MRIAAFGFRSLPSSPGSAGADKFAEELLPRLVAKGCEVIAYNRRYSNTKSTDKCYKNVRVKTFSTVNVKGLDTLLHSFKCTLHIIFTNSANIVHIQNGGNSIFALFLRLAGKKVFISQDGIDWKREKWPWFAKIYLKISIFISAYVPNTIIFDNTIARAFFEKRFNKKFEFIPFGSEVPDVQEDDTIFETLGLEKGDYYLFVGRFIPDKGLHYLIPAFLQANTTKKLVLVGGSPNPSTYETKVKEMAQENVVFAGFLYGPDVTRLMKNCYCYIQPSDVEGLSPVVLTVMGLGVPLIVSNIEENKYAVGDCALTFEKSNINSLAEAITVAENNKPLLRELSSNAKARAHSKFNWDSVTDQHLQLFEKYSNYESPQFAHSVE